MMFNLRRIKNETHKIALEYCEQGVPEVIACPEQVIGPNDHSSWGYLARMYVNNKLTSIG